MKCRENSEEDGVGYNNASLTLTEGASRPSVALLTILFELNYIVSNSFKFLSWHFSGHIDRCHMSTPLSKKDFVHFLSAAFSTGIILQSNFITACLPLISCLLHV